MISVRAFVDELEKISSAAEAIRPATSFLRRHGGKLGLVGAGATGYHLGKKELDKYMLGRQVYEQMSARG